MKQSTYFSPSYVMSRYITDNLIQRAFATIQKIQFEGNDAYVESISKVFNMDMIKDNVTDWTITFDETLWAPDDKTSVRNIIEIRYKINHNSNNILVNLDLRNDIDYYKNCCI